MSGSGAVSGGTVSPMSTTTTTTTEHDDTELTEEVEKFITSLMWTMIQKSDRDRRDHNENLGIGEEELG